MVELYLLMVMIMMWQWQLVYMAAEVSGTAMELSSWNVMSLEGF